MKLLFVDTGGWLLLADESERLHRPAVEAKNAWLEEGGVLLSTNYVFDETLTTLRARLGLDVAEKWWKRVEGSPRVRWEWLTPGHVDKAAAMFFRWHDKPFSFTDCTSFVVMRERRVGVALTSDHHFALAGFDVVPAGS
jgi:predicted nucleic acid-binding protein